MTVDLSRPAEANTVRTVVTDGNGRYRIEKVLPGAYVLAFRLPGFGSAIRDIEIGGGGPEFEYDVQLRPAVGGTFSLPGPTGPSRKVICGMTVITPTAGIDPGIQVPTKRDIPQGRAGEADDAGYSADDVLGAAWEVKSRTSEPARHRRLD